MVIDVAAIGRTVVGTVPNRGGMGKAFPNCFLHRNDRQGLSPLDLSTERGVKKRGGGEGGAVQLWRGRSREMVDSGEWMDRDAKHFCKHMP